jgi:hypothetical protein
MGIDPANIEITSVTSGSIVVDYNIIMDESITISSDELIA